MPELDLTVEAFATATLSTGVESFAGAVLLVLAAPVACHGNVSVAYWAACVYFLPLSSPLLVGVVEIGEHGHQAGAFRLNRDFSVGVGLELLRLDVFVLAVNFDVHVDVGLGFAVPQNSQLESVVRRLRHDVELQLREGPTDASWSFDLARMCFA